MKYNIIKMQTIVIQCQKQIYIELSKNANNCQ